MYLILLKLHLPLKNKRMIQLKITNNLFAIYNLLKRKNRLEIIKYIKILVFL
jgi:hypothetical protein